MTSDLQLPMRNIMTQGSLWRIWDLHVHSPATYGGDYKEFIKNAEASKAEVIGINDYCTLKGYEEIVQLGGVAGKSIFPVVEFRMHNIVANRKNADPTKSGTKINFHIIFDNDSAEFSRINNWLQSLECYNEKGETALLSNVSNLMKVTFDFEKVISSLKKHRLYERHCLVWLPYDEYGGIDDIDPNDNFFKLSLIKKSHILGSSSKAQIDFFKWKDPKHSEIQYKEWFEVPKPCIKGSDAHKIDYPFGHLRNAKSEPIEKYCWINGEKTFNGLKRIVVEPDRVYIGVEPDLLKRVRINQTKFIRSLSIEKNSKDILDTVWFDNFQIDLNASLVAIIGNKGSGKSAITDIIALCGNTHQDADNFSFLTTKKFRKAKPYNLSEKFDATLTWHDSNTSKRRLNENPNKNLPERVKYIPQNFLERLCANVDSDDFEKELKSIIFSHTPLEKRLGKSSLDELINYKSSLVVEEIKYYQGEVSKLNTDIVDLENKGTSDFKQTIENRLKLKGDELKVHQSIKPIKPENQDGQNADPTLLKRLNEIRVSIAKYELEISDDRSKRSVLLIKQEELNRALQHFTNVKDYLAKINDPSGEFNQILLKNGISQNTIFTSTINTQPIQVQIERIKAEVSSLDERIDPNNKDSLSYRVKALSDELKLKQEELNKPAKEQQKYLDALKEWQDQETVILGSLEKEGSIKFLEHQLNYLTTKLSNDLASAEGKRVELIYSLFEKKNKLIEIRKELFQPVTKFINEFEDLKTRYDVKLDVALELRSFAESFFSFINQGKIGTFNGKEEGYKKLQEIIEKSHFDTREGFVEFSNMVIEHVKHDKRSPENLPMEVSSQLKKGIEQKKLYDFVFGYEYLEPVYSLKLGNKTLEELSPGERGALLLIFYLILDNDDIPLIIDQPEENLDNESVYHILVHFIKHVKERRQIIIVTHNPNLAVVCDADQIIHMQIEKDNKNTVRCNSGAIEDGIINKTVVDVLEGTFPAFNNRSLKYARNSV